MDSYQLVTVSFALFVLGLSAFAIFAIIRSKEMRRKPLWIVGSLLGFVGLGMNWTRADDVALLYGIMIPPVMILKILPAGPVIIRTGFPVVAAVALWKMRSTGYIDRR